MASLRPTTPCAPSGGAPTPRRRSRSAAVLLVLPSQHVAGGHFLDEHPPRQVGEEREPDRSSHDPGVGVGHDVGRHLLAELGERRVGNSPRRPRRDGCSAGGSNSKNARYAARLRVEVPEDVVDRAVEEVELGSVDLPRDGRASGKRQQGECGQILDLHVEVGRHDDPRSTLEAAKKHSMVPWAIVVLVQDQHLRLVNQQRHRPARGSSINGAPPTPPAAPRGWGRRVGSGTPQPRRGSLSHEPRRRCNTQGSSPANRRAN